MLLKCPYCRMDWTFEEWLAYTDKYLGKPVTLARTPESRLFGVYYCRTCKKSSVGSKLVLEDFGT